MATGETDPHASEPLAAATVEPHSADHGEAPLGPVDWGAWVVSLVGVGAGLMVAVMLFVSIQHG